ncbi:MAG: DUF952 domain-containing protein [Spirosomaceae bacterium]|nr:DUF952 domain-containing protein [Spirosomataceae bacterium]
MIYHIVTPEYWNEFNNQEIYFSETFAKENFIHCSTIGQLSGVLERYYSGAGTVIKLEIDEEKLTTKPIYEAAPNGEDFPHIYGGINKSAVVGIEELKEESLGNYSIK